MLGRLSYFYFGSHNTACTIIQISGARTFKWGGEGEYPLRKISKRNFRLVVNAP